MILERSYLGPDGWHSVYDDGTDVLTLPAASFDPTAYTAEQVFTAQTATDVYTANQDADAHRMDWLNNDTHNGDQFVPIDGGRFATPLPTDTSAEYIGGQWGHWLHV